VDEGTQGNSFVDVLRARRHWPGTEPTLPADRRAGDDGPADVVEGSRVCACCCCCCCCAARRGLRAKETVAREGLAVALLGPSPVVEVTLLGAPDVVTSPNDRFVARRTRPGDDAPSPALEYRITGSADRDRRVASSISRLFRSCSSSSSPICFRSQSVVSEFEQWSASSFRRRRTAPSEPPRSSASRLGLWRPLPGPSVVSPEVSECRRRYPWGGVSGGVSSGVKSTVSFRSRGVVSSGGDCCVGGVGTGCVIASRGCVLTVGAPVASGAGADGCPSTADVEGTGATTAWHSEGPSEPFMIARSVAVISFGEGIFDVEESSFTGERPALTDWGLVAVGVLVNASTSFCRSMPCCRAHAWTWSATSASEANICRQT
jgi:hypothetical protein